MCDYLISISLYTELQLKLLYLFDIVCRTRLVLCITVFDEFLGLCHNVGLSLFFLFLAVSFGCLFHPLFQVLFVLQNLLCHCFPHVLVLSFLLLYGVSDKLVIDHNMVILCNLELIVDERRYICIPTIITAAPLVAFVLLSRIISLFFDIVSKVFPQTFLHLLFIPLLLFLCFLFN